MKTITDFPREIVEFADMGIVMPDGCRLSARIWMPRDAEQNPVPAILEHLPYRKRDGTTGRDSLDPSLFRRPRLCLHPRRHARQRRFRRPDGGRIHRRRNGRTPATSIAWAAAQPWCNGKVGMMGISWGGFNGLQVAALQPPALKAVITLCSTDDRYADDIHYKGGLLLNENLGWGATMLSYSSRPPDPALVGDNVARHVARAAGERTVPARRSGCSTRRRDAYWKHGSVCEDYSAIKAAVLAVGGWGDAYKNTVARLVEQPRVRRSRASSGRGSTNTRISPCPSPPSASCRRRCAGGTAG